MKNHTFHYSCKYNGHNLTLGVKSVRLNKVFLLKLFNNNFVFINLDDCKYYK